MSRGFVPQVYNEQNNTRHTEFAKVPCDVPNTALQCSLRQSSNHCKSPNHTVPRQGAAPRRTTALTLSTRTAVPIRRNVSSSLNTQDADSPSLYDKSSAVHSKQQNRQSQRGPVHDEPLSTRQRHTLNVPARVPLFPSGRFRHFLTKQFRRSSSSTNSRSTQLLARTTGFETS